LALAAAVARWMMKQKAFSHVMPAKKILWHATWMKVGSISARCGPGAAKQKQSDGGAVIMDDEKTLRIKNN